MGMRRLLGYMLRYRRRFLAGMACLLATATLAMSVPLALKCAVDELAFAVGDGAEAGADASGPCFPGLPALPIESYALLIVGIALVQAVVRSCSRFLIFNVARDVEYALRNDLFAHLETLPVEFYERQTTGDLMSRVVNDIGAVRLMLGPAVLNLLNTPVYYAYAISIMSAIDPWLTLAALSPYPLVIVVMRRNGRRLMEGTLRVQESLAEMSTTIQENVSGIHVVKSYTLEEVEEERFGRENERLRDASLSLARVRGLIAPTMRVVSALGVLVVLWLGGSRVATGRLSIGDLVAFIGYLNALAWPTMALGWMFAMVQRGRAGMQRLEAVLDVVPTISDPEATAGAAIERGEIELRGVSFAYPDDPDHPVLQDLDVRIPAGATVAIVGRAGSGKSTFLRLLPRLVDPTEGQVLIDGRDVREYRLTDLRRSISVVPQEPFLFSTSIKENIAFGVPGLLAHDADGANGESRAGGGNGADGESRAGGGSGANGESRASGGNGADGESRASGGNGAGDRSGDARVREAAAWAAVAGDVESFPHGYETMVGERGITLSGGQKQRVTLARALLVDAPVLVLDDSLSSVDTQTEEAILAELEERRRGRTCVMVAHRLSTVQDADLILVMDGGRIVARGDHSSLLAEDGLYADLFRRQRLSDELEAI